MTLNEYMDKVAQAVADEDNGDFKDHRERAEGAKSMLEHLWKAKLPPEAVARFLLESPYRKR